MTFGLPIVNSFINEATACILTAKHVSQSVAVSYDPTLPEKSRLIQEEIMLLELHIGHGSKSTYQCDYCGKIFKRFTSKGRLSERHYCNKKCKDSDHGGKTVSAVQKKHQKRMRDTYRDAKELKKNAVKKRCTSCKKEYWGPPGCFPKSRDSDEPEPGVCDYCKTIGAHSYSPEDWNEQGMGG